LAVTHLSVQFVLHLLTSIYSICCTEGEACHRVGQKSLSLGDFVTLVALKDAVGWLSM